MTTKKKRNPPLRLALIAAFGFLFDALRSRQRAPVSSRARERGSRDSRERRERKEEKTEKDKNETETLSREKTNE